MTARTRLTLLQLDGRDLPSAVAVTVERPAEYATSAIEWQQGFDQAVQASLQGIVVDTAVPIVAVFNAEAASEAAGKRALTPSEVNEILALDAQTRAIDKQLAAIENTQTQLRNQQALLQTQVDALWKLYDETRTAAQAAKKTYDDFATKNPEWWKSNDPDIRTAGFRLYGEALRLVGQGEGIKKSIEQIEKTIANIQERISVLAMQAIDLRDIRVLVQSRYDAIVRAVQEGRPSGPPAYLPVTPAPIKLSPDFLDFTKPLPRTDY